MKFDQTWWDECPLGMNPFAQTLRTVFSDLGKETVLEAWPASSSTFDEFNSPEDICWGFPRVKKIGTSFDDFDTFYILRIGKHNCLPLGFESEIFTSQLWWDYSESSVDNGVKIFMMRYLTELIYLRYDDKIEELEHERIRIKRIAANHRPLALRFEVLSRDGFKCRYCGRSASEVPLHVDHILPKSRGGVDSIHNYVTACQDCNLGKHAMLLLGDKHKKLKIQTEGQIPSFMSF